MKKCVPTLAILASLLSALVVLSQDKAEPQRERRQIPPREPRGLYAVVLAFDHHPYAAAMENPAISGLFLYYDWATLEPKKGQFDFSLLEEAFKAVFRRRAGSWMNSLPAMAGWLQAGGRAPHHPNAERPPSDFPKASRARESCMSCRCHGTLYTRGTGTRF